MTRSTKHAVWIVQSTFELASMAFGTSSAAVYNTSHWTSTNTTHTVCVYLLARNEEYCALLPTLCRTPSKHKCGLYDSHSVFCTMRQSDIICDMNLNPENPENPKNLMILVSCVLPSKLERYAEYVICPFNDEFLVNKKKKTKTNIYDIFTNRFIKITSPRR